VFVVMENKEKIQAQAERAIHELIRSQTWIDYAQIKFAGARGDAPFWKSFTSLLARSGMTLT